MRTEDFRYELPAASIAQEAVEPRDSARLLVVATMEDRTFADLPALLDPADVVVVNDTRVRAARLVGRKRETGGEVELLLLRRVDAQRWEALVKPARRLRSGVELDLGEISGELLSDPIGGMAVVALSATGGRDVEDALPAVGTVPLPPYFHGTLSDPERYQTVFAKRVGSAAAPTAALHFTPGVLAGLAARGVPVATVDLEVGIDTFRPIATETLDAHVMQTERFAVPQAAVAAVDECRARGGRVVAIGTTVVRTLESVAVPEGRIEARRGETDLFIAPGYEPRVVDALVTNFHAPATTLTVLIASLLGARWRSVYATAIERGYRFLSFGDAMYLDDTGRRR